MAIRWRQWLMVLLSIACAACVWAQGTTPKEKAADYPSHLTLPKVTIAAEYLVHSIPSKTGSLIAPDYLVIEIAVYGPAGARVALSSGDFTLRMNGKKDVLFSQSPGMVAASIKYPDWEQRPTLVGTAGVGDGNIIIGRPPMAERFPGDPRTRQTRLPAPPRASEPENRSGVEKDAPVAVDDVVSRGALPEGPQVLPVSGYLYFAFHGKKKSIKSIDLVYDGPGGTGTLRLF